MRRDHGANVLWRGIAVWGWIGWTVVVLAAWLVVAACVGMLLGRVIRQRDSQLPTGTAESFPTPRTPAQEPPLTERRPRS
jgi:uncharacterized membrane protein YoaK (UPF0700 family)